MVVRKNEKDIGLLGDYVAKEAKKEGQGGFEHEFHALYRINRWQP